MHPLVLVGLGVGVGEELGLGVGLGLGNQGSDFNEGMHNLAGVQISAQHRKRRIETMQGYIKRIISRVSGLSGHINYKQVKCYFFKDI